MNITKIKLSPIAKALSAALISSSLISSAVAAADIEQIEVTASRIQSKINEVPMAIAVIDKAALQQLNANKLSDLLRYQPGITVEKSGHRHGDANINIRGINGNRILVVKDGAIMPDGFGSAGVSQGRGNFDPFSLQQVEIIKGPASALYGSNALGGVVVLNTADPKDLVEQNNNQPHISVNSGYFSEDQRTRVGTTVASEIANGFGLFQAQGQKFAETDVNSDFSANPKDGDAKNFLAKWKYEGDQHAVELIADYYQQSAFNDLQTNLVVLDATSNTAITQSTADDKSTVWRTGVKHEVFDLGVVDRLKWQLDYQYSNYKQYEYEEITVPASAVPPIPAVNVINEEWEDFEQKQIGFNVQAEKSWQNHHLLVGLDYVNKSVSRPVTSLTTELIAGEITSDNNKSIGKTFPDADIVQYGVFIQDYIDLTDRLTAIAGVRYDRFENSPKNDEFYDNFNRTNTAPKPYNDSAVSPHLGLVYQFGEQTSLYANYSTGFRAPPVAEQYISRAILIPVPGVPHEVIPNNDLSSENSAGFELGLRWHNDLVGFEVSAYHNNYTDFIDSKTIGYREMAPVFVGNKAIRQIQYQNIDEVEIKGAEFSGHLIIDSLLPEGWQGSAQLALSVIDGKNKTNDTGLNSVPSNSAVIGFNLSPNEQLSFSWHLRGASKATDAEPYSMHGQTGEGFEPPGYGVQDIQARYFITPDFAVALSVYNLTDKKYWGAHTKGTSASADYGANVEPGRNFALTASYQF